MTRLEHLEGGPTRIRVLIVDDDRATVETMAAVLETDVDVVTCTSPARALRSLSHLDFDVVCSDFAMPEMNGIELLGQVFLHAPHAGCLLITGASEYVQREHHSVYHVLLKPYDPERLIRLVVQLGKVAQMKRSVRALKRDSSEELS